MVKYKEYSTEQYEKFLKSDFNANFGISEEQIASWFVKQPGARAVMSSYGVNESNLKSTYIPNLKAKLSGGYVMFLCITVTEGGGAGNWLNHFAGDTGNTGLACMNDDIAYVKKVWSTYYPIARSAPEVMGGANYTPDKPGEDSRVYAACGDKSIGNYFMPSTLAGNAWVFATNWCLANQSAGAPGVYFGNPYDQIIDIIKSAGGDPFTGKGSNKPSENPGAGSPGNSDRPEDNIGLQDYVKKLLDDLLKDINEGLTKHVWQDSYNTYYQSDSVKLMKTFNNRYKVTLQPHFTEAIMKKLKATNPPKPTGSGNNKPDNGKDDKPSGSEKDPTGSNVAKQIDNWVRGQVGKWYDEDGYYGAQCVDFLNAINRIVLGGVLNGHGPYAKTIYHNPLPASGWKRVPGDPNNDNNSKSIWNGLPNGSIVFFTNASAGHVAVKTGAWADCIQQNYASPNGGVNGGPVVHANIAPWIQSGGAGFLGAWVPTT